MTTTTTPKRMLVIEDDAVVAQSVRSYFEDYDFQVTAIGDGRAGLELFKKQGADVVLVDLYVPGADGLQVLHDVREVSPETPVLVISGRGTLPDVVQALRLGAWDYLIKPVTDMSILRFAVQRALERADLIRENRQHREHLEEEVRARTSQLNEVNHELERKNVALREVLASIESQKDTLGRSIVSNVEKAILPMIHGLHRGATAQQQRRLDQIEASLRQITSPFMNKLANDAAKLSPMELRITSLIRRGLSIKEIASMEHISTGTVSTHRRSIRRKLGIINTKVNLTSFLESRFRDDKSITSADAI